MPPDEPLRDGLPKNTTLVSVPSVTAAAGAAVPQQSVRPTLHPAETHFRHIQQTNGSRVSLGGSALWRPPVKQASKSKRSIHPAAISALCLHTATAVDMPIFCRSFLSESNDRQDVCKTSAGQGQRRRGWNKRN